MTITTCPSCSYVRQATDLAPAWQCPNCGVAYTEYDIEHNAAAEKGYRRLRGNGVPVVVVGEQVIHGYNPEAMEDALRPWLR